MPDHETKPAPDPCRACGALPCDQTQPAVDDALLLKLANDAFVVMNWARKQGMKKDAQMAETVAAFKLTLAERA